MAEITQCNQQYQFLISSDRKLGLPDFHPNGISKLQTHHLVNPHSSPARYFQFRIFFSFLIKLDDFCAGK
jgi:hypothetical protein